jgi:outer membrane protein OmpA-like peptidoglycan-associated protein
MSHEIATRNFAAVPVRSIAIAAASGVILLSGVVGCSSKNYVRSQTAPIVQNVNELDAKTASDHRAIVDTDQRATQGINSAQAAADKANQDALAASQAADKANSSAQEAVNHVDTLNGTIANLDQYKTLSDVSVTFKFDKAVLTASDKEQLDQLAQSLASTRGYILQVTGGTDSTGNAEYNYRLSERRANAVVNYLSAKYNVPPHKFYLVGIGKDKQVADDHTRAGRAKNRRVDVQVLSNMSSSTTNSTTATNPTPAPSAQ